VDSPLVRYAANSEELLATCAALMFFFVWTVRRLDRRRGYLAEALFESSGTATAVAVFFADGGLHSTTANSTSITADWLTTSLVTLAAAFVACCRVQRRRQQGRAAG
jgi:hypothetical protein